MIAKSRSTSTIRRESGSRIAVTIPLMAHGPLKRVIQRAVQDPLSELILSGAIKDGDTARVTSGADGLIINGRAFSLAA